MWHVARERALLLGGPAALLLQLAHPLVAAGVAQHSDFRSDPLWRLNRTINATLAVTFGEADQAAAAAAATRRVHLRVTGELPIAQGYWAAGTRYRATDPQLGLWVFATLIETALDAYELFVGRLTMSARSRYYDGSDAFAAAFGVRPPVLPASYRDFRRYYEGMIRDRLVVAELAGEQARGVLQARLWRVPVTAPATALASLLLPTSLRQAYRLPPVPRATAWPIRTALRCVPPSLRYWPEYHTAMRRCSTATARGGRPGRSVRRRRDTGHERPDPRSAPRSR